MQKKKKKQIGAIKASETVAAAASTDKHQQHCTAPAMSSTNKLLFLINISFFYIVYYTQLVY